MKIDASRYSLFLSNPDEYRIRECWNLFPKGNGGQPSNYTFGRRRGSMFHELSDGANPDDLNYGEDVQKVALQLFEANEKYSQKLGDVTLWSEKEFDIPIPGSPHRMVGRIDRFIERYDRRFILDFKTSKHRTKEDWKTYIQEKEQSPQVDFYLLACPESEGFVYRILSKHPNPPKKDPEPIKIFEIECSRTKWELQAFQWGVHMVCETIELWKREFGINKPWPRAKWTWPDFYPYRPLYQRNIYPGAEYEGFVPREEHLEVLRNDEKPASGDELRTASSCGPVEEGAGSN